MFLRVTLAAGNPETSRRFYETVLPELEVEDWQEFSVAAGPPVTRGLHIGFAAASREHVDAFWRAGTEAGYRDDGAPGPRPQYGPDYYGGFLLDPDGNSAEAVHNDSLGAGGIVDHLWIRVADLDASRAFYEEVGRRVGFHVGWHAEDPRRTGFTDGSRSFSVVAGPPAENVHVAFQADRAETLIDPDGNTVELSAS
jgi:catechol 2,3-dioxygenase-like lactoylglutathione lyase family enzyme